MKLYASIYVFAYMLLLITAIYLAYYGEEEMTFLGNSLSDLGAQQAKGNWALNTAIACMGIATLVYGSYALKQQWMFLVIVYFFGVSFGMTGIYKAAGFDALTNYDYAQDTLHSLFLVVSSFAFVLLCIGILFKVKVLDYKVQTSIVLLGIFFLFFLQFQFPEYKGLFHQLLLFIAFGWLFYVFTSYNFEKNTRPRFNKTRVYQKLKKQLFQDEK